MTKRLVPRRSGDARCFDPFRVLSPGQREAHLDRYTSYLEARNGELDLPGRSLSRREAFFRRIEADPIRSRGEAVDREGFRAHVERRAGPPLDPRTAWLVAVARANEGESYGVELELARFVGTGGEGTDRAMAYVFLEEEYHSRILVEACRTCGVETRVRLPRWRMRLMSRLIFHLPERWRWTLVLCGEILGTGVFEFLLERCALFSEEPEVEERLRSLLFEIWRDEVLHVASLRARLGPVAMGAARLLLPLVVGTLLRDVPQLRVLGCDRRALLARLRRGVEIPPDVDWLDADAVPA